MQEDCNCDQSDIVSTNYITIDEGLGWIICQFNATSSYLSGGFNFLSRNFYLGLAGDLQERLAVVNGTLAPGVVFYDPQSVSGASGGVLVGSWMSGRPGHPKDYFGSSNMDQDFFKLLRVRVGPAPVKSQAAATVPDLWSCRLRILAACSSFVVHFCACYVCISALISELLDALAARSRFTAASEAE